MLLIILISSKDTPRLYVAVLTSPPFLHRLKPLVNTWGNKFMNSSFYEKLEFFVEKECIDEVTGIKPRVVDVRGFKGVPTLIWKDIEAGRIFLNESKANWFLRTTDDCWMNVNVMKNYINYLNKHHDPQKEIVIKGSLVKVHPRKYIQGGSGWIMSRKAVIEFVKQGESWVKSCNVKTGDDVCFTNFLDQTLLKDEEIDTKRILGSRFSSNDQRRFLTNNFRNIRNCPRGEGLKFTDLALWHSKFIIDDQMERALTYIKQTRNKIGFYRRGGTPMLCKLVPRRRVKGIYLKAMND